MVRKKKTPTRKRHRYDRNAIGPTVARLRKASKLTRKQLAARAHVGGWSIESYVLTDIERGAREVTDIELRFLANALRVPVAALFD